MVNTFELQAFLRTESDDGALVSDYNLTPVEMLDKHTNMKIMAHIFVFLFFKGDLSIAFLCMLGPSVLGQASFIQEAFGQASL
jgi:hypothetical protein